MRNYMLFRFVLMFIYVFVCTHVHTPEESTGVCGDGVTGSGEPPSLGTGAALSPLLEQYPLITTEPSPAPLRMFSYCVLCYLLPLVKKHQCVSG